MILEEETIKELGVSFADAKQKSKIVCSCDYCGVVFRALKHNLQRAMKTIPKLACPDYACVQRKRVEVNQALYQVDNVFQLEAKKEKIKQTNLEQRGVENSMQCPEVRAKAEETNLRLYGVKNVFASPEIQEKIRQHWLDKEGVENPFQVPAIQERQRATIRLNHGVDHYSQTDEFKLKLQQTCQDHFGYDSYLQTPELREILKQDSLERFGVDNPAKSEICKNKSKRTCNEEYGVDNPMQSANVLQRAQNTCLENFGVANPFQCQQLRDKAKATCLVNHGVENPMQSPAILRKSRETCINLHGKFPVNNYGKTQNEIKEWLNTFGFNFQTSYDLVPGLEIDLYDPVKALAIEYCGLYWHNELSPEPRGRQYHRAKYKACLEQDVQLITIFSDEWKYRNSQCKGHIKSILGIHESKYFARKCKIESIPVQTAREFFDLYHIQESSKLSLVAFGLVVDDQLLGAMSLGHHHRQSEDLVLDRLCFRDGVQVVGGASKLLVRCAEWAREKGHTRIVSFSDNRWSLGRVYERMGFWCEHEYGPDYAYVEMKKPARRISKQSQRKKLTGCPQHLTEAEWAIERNLGRIYDCGKKRWVYDL